MSKTIPMASVADDQPKPHRPKLVDEHEPPRRKRESARDELNREAMICLFQTVRNCVSVIVPVLFLGCCFRVYLWVEAERQASRIEAAKEQMAERMQQKMKESLDKIGK